MSVAVTRKPTAEQAAAAARHEARLAAQRHDMDLDGQEAYFAAYAIDHPEWGGPEVAE